MPKDAPRRRPRRIPPPPPPAGSERKPERWIDEGPVRPAGRSRGSSGASPTRSRTRGPRITVDPAELSGVANAKRAQVLAERLGDAATAFSRERYPEAARILRPIVEEVPESASVRELAGLTYYRQGRWKAASRELEAFVALTGGSTEQHPVLADCYRAQRRYGRVEELWAELREASPSAELVTEGRIVAAGALADRGRLEEAIALLEKGRRAPKRPGPHHLRRAYALADLYERAGDLPRARAGFGWVEGHDPDFADVAERVAALR